MAIPSTSPTRTRSQLSGNLWFLYLNGSAPGELERFISDRSNHDTCIRILLRDHTYDTLNGLRDRISQFVDERVKNDPELSECARVVSGGPRGTLSGRE